MALMQDPQNHSSDPTINHSVSPVAATDLGTPDYNNRILPRQISSGALRGTQNVGYGGVRIDGSNNQITIGSVTNTIGEKAETIIGKLSSNPNDQSFGLRVINADGLEVTYGLLSDGSPGMQIADASGFVLFKLSGETWSWFDKNYNTNTMQAGLLPDGNYGWVTVPPANNVSDAFRD